MERTSLAIEGMTCDHCVRGVNRALQALEGVEVERVDIGSATIAYDPQAVTPAQITEVIEEEGYTLQSMERAR